MIISVKDVRKSYGKEKVIKGVSFQLEEPKIIALVGPNGSGKSTLLNIITNLIPADSGKVTILGKSNKDPEIFKEISFMQDNSVLYDYLTGYDHLQFIGDVQGESKEQLMETAKRVGMASYVNKKVGNYSLGMKQHLLLTIAMANNPKLLILDEPLNGLDPTSAIRVRELLLDLNENGTAVILSSHNLGEIDRITSQILFLKNGRLIEEDISQHERVSYQFEVNHPNEGEKALKESGLQVNRNGNRLSVYLDNITLNVVFAIFEQRNITIIDMNKKVLGSEDRYQKIFGKQVMTSENSSV